jgi:hypothetical protein
MDTLNQNEFVLLEIQKEFRLLQFLDYEKKSYNSTIKNIKKLARQLQVVDDEV